MLLNVSELSTETLEKMKEQCKATINELSLLENQLDMLNQTQLNNARYVYPSVALELTLREIKGGTKS